LEGIGRAGRTHDEFSLFSSGEYAHATLTAMCKAYSTCYNEFQAIVSHG